MKAIGVTEFGGPGALHVVEIPDPEAGPGQVRIRVRAAVVNPTDTGLRSGARTVDVPPPYVPGMDVAGVLEQIGPDTPVSGAAGAVGGYAVQLGKTAGLRVVAVRGFKGQEERGITFHPVTVRSYAREHAKLDNLRRMAEVGQLTLRVARVLLAEHAAEAHRILEAGGTRAGWCWNSDPHDR